MKAMKTIAVAVAVLALAGCQTQQSVLPPQQPTVPSAPQTPATPSQSAPKPQSAGPLTKAGVETYMDAQETDLRSHLRKQGVLVARRGDTLAVVVPSDRIFDKSEISSWGSAFLATLGQVMTHYDHTKVEVNCYTDASGSDQQNLALSQKRAKAVADGLEHNGVAASRVTASGLGATNPIGTNAKDARNRRIEIRIVPTPH